MAFLLAGSLTPALAQNELSNFTATGRGGAINAYATEYQALGINPANLGRATGVKVAFTIGEAGVGVSSKTAPRSLFNDFIFSTEKRFQTDAERRQAVDAFTGKDAINLEGVVTLFGLSFYHPAAGGFALNTRYRMIGHADLNRNAADILLRGRNAEIFRSTTAPTVSQALDGTYIHMETVQEFNFGYGRKLVEGEGIEVYAGVGYKFLRGIGLYELRSEGGKLSSFSSLSPSFEPQYVPEIRNDPNFKYKTKDGSSARYPAVGSGSGYDIGVSATIADKVRLSASVIDLGKITWQNNTLEVRDLPLELPADTGFVGKGPITYNMWKAMKNFQINGDTGTSPFRNRVVGEKSVKLPSRMRLGAGMDIGEHVTVAADALIPFDPKIPGSYKSALLGAGVTYKPVWWLQLSTGVSGGAGYGLSLPLGIAFSTHHYEGGFGTRDVTGWMGEKNPYLSAVFGFLRFKIGKPENPM